MAKGFLHSKPGGGGGSTAKKIKFVLKGTAPAAPKKMGAKYGATLYVLTTTNNKIMYSSDGGATWTLQTLGITVTGNSLKTSGEECGLLTCANAGRVALGYFDGSGLSWLVYQGTTTLITTSYPTWDVVWFNRLQVCVGGGGKLSTYDGSTWTARTSQFGTSTIYGVFTHRGCLVAYGSSGKISTSTDGITWTARTGPFGTYDIYFGYSFGNKMVLINSYGEISYSTDFGVTWSAKVKLNASIGYYPNTTMGAFFEGNGKMFFSGRSIDNISEVARHFYSEDGITFTQYSPVDESGTAMSNSFLPFAYHDGVLYGSIGTSIYTCDMKNEISA